MTTTNDDHTRGPGERLFEGQDLPRPASHPIFDVTFGTNSQTTTVRVNGTDITRLLNGVQFECMAGGLTKATLIVRPGHARATVQGAIEAFELQGPPAADASDPPVDRTGHPSQREGSD